MALTLAEKGTTLVLTKKEKDTLFTLLYLHMTGPDAGPRGVLEEITNALALADAEQVPMTMDNTNTLSNEFWIE